MQFTVNNAKMQVHLVTAVLLASLVLSGCSVSEEGAESPGGGGNNAALQAAAAAADETRRCPFAGADELVAEVLGEPASSVGLDRMDDSAAITCDWEDPDGNIVLSLLVDGIGDLGLYDNHTVVSERTVEGVKTQVTAPRGASDVDQLADELLDIVARELTA